MDNPGDDPRAHTITLGHASNNDSGHLLRDDDEGERPVGGMANLLQFLSAMVEPSGNRPSSGGGSGSGGGMRVVINGPRGVRTVQLGGPNTLGGGDTHPREGGVSRLSEYAPPDHCFESHFHTFLVTLLPQLENLRLLTEVGLGGIQRQPSRHIFCPV